jgi:hypothetical protein
VKLEKKCLTLEAYLDSIDVNDIGKSLIFSDLEDEDESEAQAFKNRPRAPEKEIKQMYAAENTSFSSR